MDPARTRPPGRPALTDETCRSLVGKKARGKTGVGLYGRHTGSLARRPHTTRPPPGYLLQLGGQRLYLLLVRLFPLVSLVGGLHLLLGGFIRTLNAPLGPYTASLGP